MLRMLYIILLILSLIIVLPVLLIVVLAFIYRKKLRFSEHFSQIYDAVYDMMEKGNFNFENLYNSQQGDAAGPSTSSRMSKSQAREILGVSADATKAEINKAYHALVQKIHPDKGGSHYLTQQLNKARDALLK